LLVAQWIRVSARRREGWCQIEIDGCRTLGGGQPHSSGSDLLVMRSRLETNHQIATCGTRRWGGRASIFNIIYTIINILLNVIDSTFNFIRSVIYGIIIRITPH